MPFFQTLTSLFSTTGNPNSAAASRHKTRPSQMQAGMDAFSLPTTRYPGANGVTDSASSSPGPSRRASSSNYTAYPPAKESYQPAALTYYPPLSHTYHRLRVALSSTFPELLDTLNYPVDPVLLASFEAELGCALPPSVRESFTVADGQDVEAAISLGSTGTFFGLVFLPLEEAMREWAFWRQAEHDPSSGQNAAVLATMASVPPGWIQSQYACRGWVPLMSDRTGNYVGIDLDPGKGGSRGQVIVFGRDFDRKCVLWKGEGEGGWGRWLAALVDELETGEGAGWEADKSASSSDEEDEVGYTDYGGGAAYGEAARALRLTGQYKGWNTLEAWWDKSVSRWEEMGMGMDVAEVERGLAEARRLTGAEEDEGSQGGIGKGKGREVDGLGIGMGVGTSAAQVEIPVVGTTIPHPPGTPTPHDSDALIPPASPDVSTIPRISQTSSSPRRVITPLPSASDHPLSSTTSATVDSRGFLSPPVSGSSGGGSYSSASRRRTRPVPAPTPLDLPTRADVQAMSAIAMAQDSGLRGGWVMNIDSTGGARRGAARAANADGLGAGYGYGQHPSSDPRRPSTDGMVDIDLEGGRGDRVGGSSERWRVEMERQREEEKLALAGVEHRRPSPSLLPRNSWSSAGTSPSGTRSPSPSPLGMSMGIAIPQTASRTGSPSPFDPSNTHALSNPYTGGYEYPADATPRAGLRERDDPLQGLQGLQGLRPPPAASQTQAPSWEKSEDGDREVIRASAAAIAGRGRPSDSFYGAPRVERESSTTSLSSETGLLERSGSGTGTIRRPAELSIDVPNTSPLAHTRDPVRRGMGTEGEGDRSPPMVYSSPVHSPSKMNEGKGEAGMEGMMQDISLDDAAVGSALRGGDDGNEEGMSGSPTTPTAPKRPVAV